MGNHYVRSPNSVYFEPPKNAFNPLGVNALDNDHTQHQLINFFLLLLRFISARLRTSRSASGSASAARIGLLNSFILGLFAAKG